MLVAIIVEGLAPGQSAVLFHLTAVPIVLPAEGTCLLWAGGLAWFI